MSDHLDYYGILQLPDWESRLSADEMPLESWVKLARLIRKSDNDRKAQLTTRIQILVVEAGLVDDSGFMDLLEA